MKFDLSQIDITVRFATILKSQELIGKMKNYVILKVNS